jgi:CheY-like chemotaxis protein
VLGQASMFLVEDEVLIRMMLADMVEALGHRVVAEAGNIQDAQVLAETAFFELPKSEHDTPEWRLAVQMLIDAAEDRGPMLFAKMGIQRATERYTGPQGKVPSSQRRKLKTSR